MATNRILTNAKEFVKTLDEAGKAINRQTLIGISGWMDLVRKDSVDSFMEKNKFASQTIIKRTKQGDVRAWVKSGNGFRRHDSIQKSVANKLTIRTRRLASVVEAVGTWKVNRPGTECKFTGAGKVGQLIRMWVRPQSNGYLSRFTFGEKNDTYLNKRLDKSKQRPFLQPAIAKNTTAFDTQVWKRLQSVANKTL